MYDTKIMIYFGLHFAVLAATWVATLRFIRSNEYSNAHIDWASQEVVPNETRCGTQIAAAFAVAVGIIIAFDSLRPGIIAQELLRNTMFAAQIVLACSYLFFYQSTVSRARRNCIRRNQPRLDSYMAIAIFNRKYNCRF